MNIFDTLLIVGIKQCSVHGSKYALKDSIIKT